VPFLQVNCLVTIILIFIFLPEIVNGNCEIEKIEASFDCLTGNLESTWQFFFSRLINCLLEDYFRTNWVTCCIWNWKKLQEIKCCASDKVLEVHIIFGTNCTKMLHVVDASYVSNNCKLFAGIKCFCSV
jgi:hypothetical protein